MIKNAPYQTKVVNSNHISLPMYRNLIPHDNLMLLFGALYPPIPFLSDNGLKKKRSDSPKFGTINDDTRSIIAISPGWQMNHLTAVAIYIYPKAFTPATKMEEEAHVKIR